jgi:tyrosine-protein kinase Etk/Wzc
LAHDGIHPEQASNTSSRDSNDESEGMNLFDLLILLSSKKRLILFSALGVALLATALAFIIPPTYTATALILLPQQQSSMASALLGQIQSAGALSSLANQSLGIKNPSDLYVGILKSHTVEDELIAQFGLKNIYKKKYLADARKKLEKRTDFNTSKSSLIQISVEDRDPNRAADLANAYIDKLQKQISRLAVTEASQRRLFFENQVQMEKELLSEAEAAFKKMQEKKGIYQVSSQVEAVIRSMAQMRAEIVAREVNLQRLKTGATTQNPEVLRQETELKALQIQLKEFEANNTSRSQGDPLMPTTMLPEAGLEYARNLREVKYRETLYELLAKQYEVARIDEAKEAPLIQVVDRAVAPDKKTAPFRELYIILGTLIGGILGFLLAVLENSFQNPVYAQKLVALRSSLLNRSKK